MPTNALRVDSVNSYYGDSHILQNVSFTVGSGKVVALLGRNGAGKTTCMNTIAGLMRPRSGSVTINDRPIAGSAPESICNAGVALVPQGRRIFRSLTVTENLLVARRRPTPPGRVVWDIADIFRLFPRLNERRHNQADRLSGGEQQMLAIGRALMTCPSVLLMDEPTEGLAPQIVAEVGKIITELRSLGLSIVLVEQHTNFALRLADDVVIINTGEIVARAKASEIVANNELIQAYLGVH